MRKDVFLCHASEDKELLARPLYEALEAAGVTTWFDEAEIAWGDSIAGKIQVGLLESSKVLVLLTPSFVAPGGRWRGEELNTSLAEQVASGKTRVLPLVRGLTHDEIRHRLPIVASRRYERLDEGTTLTAVADLVRRRIAERSAPRLLERAEVDRAVGTVEERLRRATEAVWISGIDNMFVTRALSGFVEKALARGIAVRILCVDPESPAADMIPLVDPRFGDKAFFVREVCSVESVLRGWKERYPHFEYRFLPILPAVGYFITDPGAATETVKLEIYTAKPWGPMDTRPHLALGLEMAEWRQYFVEQFRNYWALSRTPSATTPTGT